GGVRQFTDSDTVEHDDDGSLERFHVNHTRLGKRNVPLCSERDVKRLESYTWRSRPPLRRALAAARVSGESPEPSSQIRLGSFGTQTSRGPPSRRFSWLMSARVDASSRTP